MNEVKIIVGISVLLVSVLFVNEAFAQPTEIWFWNSQDVIDDNPNITSTTNTNDITCFIGLPSTQTIGKCYLFKSFNATEVSGLNVTTTWSAEVSGIQTGENRIDVRDGLYSLGDTDFPQNATFPVSKGNGLLLRAFESFGDGSVPQRTDNFIMPFANQSSTGFVTVFFETDDTDNFPANSNQLHLNNFTMTFFASWKFGTDEGSVNRNGDFASDGCTEGCGDFTGHGFLDLTDITPPIITLLGENPQQSLKGSTYGEQGATCIDAIFGDNSANIVVDSSAVDTNTIGSFIVTYDCTDTSPNTNIAIQVTRTVNVIQLGGGGGYALSNPSGSGGIGTGVSKLSDLPPLVQPTAPPTDVDRALSFFDQLNSLFDFDRPQEQVTIPDAPTTPTTPAPTPEPDQRESFVDRIRDFFSSLFGFIFGYELIPVAFGSDLNTTDVLHRLSESRFASGGIEVQQVNKTIGQNLGSAVPLTFPDPIISTYNATWQYREHNRGGSDSGLMWVLDCNSISPDLRCEGGQDGLEMLDLDNAKLPDLELVGSDWYFFKTFESPDPIFWDDIRVNFPTRPQVENGTADTSLLNSTLSIFDGAYDRRSNTDFPDGQPIALKGNGLLHECDRRIGTHSSTQNYICRQPDGSFPNPLFNSTTGFITVMFKRVQCDTCGGHTRIQSVEQRNVMKWDFVPVANTIVRELEGTTGDHGLVTAGSFTIDDPVEGRFDLDFTKSMTIDPTNNLIYGLFKTRANSFDNQNVALGLINHVTGTVQLIKILAGAFTGLQFNHDGELRAVCDNDCDRVTIVSPHTHLFDPQDYVAINKTTGKITNLCNTGLDNNISDREFTLGQDTDTETMIISGGSRFFGFDPVVRSIDNESTCALSTITITGFDVGNEEGNTALAYHTGDDLFYGMFGSGADSVDFFSQNSTGFRTQIANDPFFGDAQSGLAFFYDIGDVVPAVLTLLGNDPQDVDQFTTYVDAGATCLDNFDGVCDGSIVTVNPVNTNIVDTYIVTYDHQDTSGNDAVQLTRTVNVIDKEAPVITIIGDAIIEVAQGATYVDQGATATDNVDGDVTSSISTINPVNTSIIDAYFVTYIVTDSNGNTGNLSRTVIVVSPSEITGGGITSGAGSVGDPFTVADFTQQQLAFQQSLDDALSRIADTEASPIEAIIQTFFEFIVIDTTHDQLTLNSFLDGERLGFRWSSPDDIVIVSAVTAPSPFTITFEKLPVVKQGSPFVSTNFILYQLEVPRQQCGMGITQNCVEKVRYEIPVTLNAVIDGVQVSNTGTITVDLTDELIDPILLILMATFSIPLIGVIIQRARGRPSIEAIRRVAS